MNKNIKLAVFCLTVTLFAFALYAQEREPDMSQVRQLMGDAVTQDAADDFTAQEYEGNIVIDVFKIIGWLVLVLTLIAVTAWVVRKTGLVRGVAPVSAQTPSMKVLEAMTTGQGGIMLLVRCEESVFLIGQTQANYTLLHELPKDSARKIIESKTGTETVGAFKNSLSNFMQNIKVSQ